MTWASLTGEPLPLAPYVPARPLSLNGHHAKAAPSSAKRVMFAGLVRQLAIATMAGMAGGFVTGLWARIVMRLAGYLTIDSHRGLLTENNAVVGEITFAGTMAIAVTGAIMGVLGGVLYVAVRRWLPGNVWQRAATFGVLLLAVFGFVVMDRSNPDYRLFGPAWLNVGTFSLAYLVFGLVAGSTAEWLEVKMPRLGRAGGSRRRRFAVGALLTPFALIGLLWFLLAGVGVAGLTGILIAAVIAVAQLPANRLLRIRRFTIRVPRPDLIGYAALAAPSLIGFTLTVRAIVDIVGG
jgi:hypothetical protein